MVRLLLIVCGDVELNSGPGSDKKVWVLYSNIRGLHANLDELAVTGPDYDVLVSAESKVSDRCHLSELCINALVAPNRGCRTPRSLLLLLIIAFCLVVSSWFVVTLTLR